MSGDDRQLELFDAPPAGRREPERDRSASTAGLADAAPREAALERLAERVPAHVRLGTSSWTFPGWAGIVYHRRYPSQKAFTRESLAEYARHPLMRTVGVDRSYYDPLPASEWASYASLLPDGFECVVKVWQELTTFVFPKHPKHGERAGRPNACFLDPERFEQDVAGELRAGLSGHTGPLVLEIPPLPGRADVRTFERAVEHFLERAPGDLRYAFELRHPKLMTDRYLAILRAHGASHVLNFHSRMPPMREQMAREGVVDAPFFVARLMLPPGRRYDEQKKAFEPFDRIVEPQPEMRDDVVRLCREAGERGRTAWVLVNNKAEGSSPLTVRALAELLVEG